MSDLHIRLTMTGLAQGHLKLFNVIVLVRHRFVANVHFAPPAYVVGIVTHSPSSVQREIARDRKWPVTLTGNQGFVNALAKPFDIGRMDEKFAMQLELLAPFRHWVRTCNIAIEDPTILSMHIVKRPYF